MSEQKPCAACGGPITEWAYPRYKSKSGKRYCSSTCKDVPPKPVCSQGKVRYPTQAAVLTAITRTIRKQDRVAKLRAYYHHQCHAWHMTSHDRKDRAA